jgi:hypothetical protein
MKRVMDCATASTGATAIDGGAAAGLAAACGSDPAHPVAVMAPAARTTAMK